VAEWEAALSHKVKVQRPSRPQQQQQQQRAGAGAEEGREGDGDGEMKDESEEGGGEAPVPVLVPAVLAQWLPWGYDLYVIGVQESACLKEMRRAVHEYLGACLSACLYA
jgi:hypothetical protein